MSAGHASVESSLYNNLHFCPGLRYRYYITFSFSRRRLFLDSVSFSPQGLFLLYRSTTHCLNVIDYIYFLKKT